MAQQQPQSNDPQGQANQQNDENKPKFSLQRVYVKDLSLEMPNAPQVFLEQETPAVDVNINVGAQRLADTIFETTVIATVTTRVDEQVLYLVEATQAGIFEVENIPDDQINALLGIVCPTMLYPYLRATIADAINRTSLPPLHLSEVNFQRLYEQRAAQAQQQAQEGQAAPQAQPGVEQGSPTQGNN